ncbi:MAG TPA: hypothetical protein VK348_11165, partial [Planctomycetota bacterium]|nr:hypothetical protein [Planctomycetota bacterium]
MIKVQTLSLRGLCIATLLVFAACSGAPSTEGDTPTGPSQPSTTAPRANPQGQGQGVSHERNLQLVSDAVNKARRSLELRLFEDAQREAAFALELDNGNEEARRILNQCNEVLGDKVARAINQEGDAVLRNRIAAERERALVRNELQLGNANFDLGAFGRAIENYEKALAYLNFSQHFPPNDPLRKEAEERLDSATKAKAEADKAQGRSLQAASQADLDREARDLAAAKATMVERYLQDANVKFQSGDYKEAVDRVQQALLQDPTNPTALALRDLADRARHETSLELHRERWKQDWITTFNELQQSNLPQTDVVKFDPARWAEVSQRAPATYTQPSELDTPEVKQIQKKLDETVLEHNFSSATVDAWAHYYSSVTSVTFFVMDDVKAMAPESTTLNDFKLPRMSVTQALKVIQSQTGVAWRIKNGMVQLVSPANAIGTLYLSRHRVADLVLGVKGHPGPELKLASPGDDSPLFPEDTTDPVPSVVDDGRLRELIQSTVAEGKWENNPFSLNYQAGVLLIRADAETHEKVARLLNDLRRHVGIQVDVEARFLKVEDNFLEDVGIDLRGLGNQASQGQAGQGLGARPNVGFDDFGPKQQQNAATPGTVGTGTEPGVFFDNGRDGDVMGRVENLYDQTLGG